VLLAAAAGEKNNSDDYQPEGAVVKKVAQAVIHKCNSFQGLENFAFSISYYVITVRMVTKSARAKNTRKNTFLPLTLHTLFAII
jgi:hypothetical protein